MLRLINGVLILNQRVFYSLRERIALVAGAHATDLSSNSWAVSGPYHMLGGAGYQ
jgi:hypothetical protein